MNQQGDQYNNLGQQRPAGQPSAPNAPQAPAPQGQPAAASSPEREYLTRAEAQRLAAEAEERAFRRAQGLLAKTNERVQGRLSDLETHLQMQASAGAPVAPEVAAKLREQVTAQALREDDPAQPTPQAQQPPNTEQLPPALQEANRMMQEAGVFIEDGDPEVQTLDMSSPGKFFASLDRAIQAKRQRTSNDPQQAGVNQHNLPGLTGGSPGAPFTGQSATAMISNYFKDK